VLVADLLQDLPGVAVSRSGGPGAQTQVRIRGAEGNHLLVLIDGIEVNDPAAADEFSFEHLTTWDVERIELVRGPQSALWGSDAIAGVLNVVTRTGNQPLRGDLLAEGGSASTTNLGARVGGTLGRLSGDLLVSGYETDGENISLSGGEEDGYRNASGMLKVNFQATDTLSFSLLGRLADATNEFDDTVSTGIPTDADLESDVSLGYMRAGARLGLMGNRWQHSLSGSFSDTQRENFCSGSRTDEQQGERTGVYYQTSYDLTSSPGEYRIVMAVDHEREEFTQRYFSFEGADQSRSRETTGYVAELVVRPLDELDLSLSLRRDDNSDFEDKTSFRLAGSYQLRPLSARLHGSYGTGMKQPTFTELFGFFPDFFVGNPNLKPEESEAWDIGIQRSFFADRVTADITYFSARLTDEIQDLFTTVVNSPGTSRRKGIELELAAPLTESLSGSMSYTYTDSREPDSAGDDRQELRRPRHMAAANLNYTFWQNRANLNLNVSYTGEQRDLDFSGFPASIVQLDDYVLVNVTASYALSDMVSLQARAENLFDEDYQNVFGFRNPGAAWYAGLRMRFGR
jgi:vitamin B12 transporter